MSPGRGHLNNSERSLEGEEVRGDPWREEWGLNYHSVPGTLYITRR